jgi:hypothetical protein
LYNQTLKVLYFYHGKNRSTEAITQSNTVLEVSNKYDPDVIIFPRVDLDSEDGQKIWHGLFPERAIPSKFPRFVLFWPLPNSQARTSIMESSTPYIKADQIEATIADSMNIRPVTTTTPTFCASSAWTWIHRVVRLFGVTCPRVQLSLLGRHGFLSLILVSQKVTNQIRRRRTPHIWAW